MKRTLQTLLSVAVISSLTCVPAIAEDGGKAEPKKEKKAEKKKAPKISKWVQKQMAELAELVPDLTPEQKEKLLPVVQEKSDAFLAAKKLKDNGGSEEDFKAKKKEGFQAANAKIKEILSREQFKAMVVAKKAKAAARKAKEAK